MRQRMRWRTGWIPAQSSALIAFPIPDDISVRELEQIAFVRLARLFWRMSRDIACEPRPLPAMPIAWSGTRSTRRMYQELCEIPAGISAT